jgi:putative FmdB family regulatory protein
MPIYEFECEECGHRFDRLMKMSESEVHPPCPKEGIRVLQPFSFQGCVFKPGFAEGMARVYMPCSKDDGMPVFDRDHFIDKEAQPTADMDAATFGMTNAAGEHLESLDGYVQGVCGGETKRVMSPGTFHLKGGGWYKDGY